MKVIHKTTSLLMLEDRPWRIGLLVIGMAMIGVFASMSMIGSGEVLAGSAMAVFGVGGVLLIGAMLIKRVRLILNRDTGQITRISRSIGGLHQEDFALARLVGASVGSRRDSKGITRRTELLLSGPSETVPFTDYYTSGGKPDRMAQAINDWLARPQVPAAPSRPLVIVKDS